MFWRQSNLFQLQAVAPDWLLCLADLRLNDTFSEWRSVVPPSVDPAPSPPYRSALCTLPASLHDPHAASPWPLLPFSTVLRWGSREEIATLMFSQNSHWEREILNELNGRRGRQ